MIVVAAKANVRCACGATMDAEGSDAFISYELSKWNELHKDHGGQLLSRAIKLVDGRIQLVDDDEVRQPPSHPSGSIEDNYEGMAKRMESAYPPPPPDSSEQTGKKGR